MVKEIDELAQAYYEKPRKMETWSGLSLKEVYTPKDMEDIEQERDIGEAGEYPFTRGIHLNMYRGRYWTRREVIGYGMPADTNNRLKLQIAEGVTGLNVITDLPGALNIDGDHPLAHREIGVCGVPWNSLKDMEELLDGIPIDKVSFSIIHHSPVVLAQYIAVAQNRGIDLARLSGTLQNDPLQNRHCYSKASLPVDLSLKLAVDVIEYCTKHMPLWYTGNVNFYNWRETGINAAQELAFGFAMATAYIDGALRRGLNIDDFAPRRAFYCSAHIDFFEEIAKLRAARRMWARIMKERYGAKDPRSWQFRFGVHTAGCSLVPQQPLNNIVRIAYEGLAAVLAGVQSLHCCSYDEPIGLPTEESQRVALRTQQILAYETGVTNVTDPLGGSYYIENLTNRTEEEANRILKEIEDRGGALEALRQDWFERETEKAALNHQQGIDSREKIMVGVNAFALPREKETPGGVHRVSPESQRTALENLRRLKERRDNKKLRESIARLREEAERGEQVNLMPAMIDAVKAYATLAEINGTICQAYGLSYDPFKVIESPFA